MPAACIPEAVLPLYGSARLICLLAQSAPYTNSVVQAGRDSFRAAPLQSAALGLGLVGLGQDTVLPLRALSLLTLIW